MLVNDFAADILLDLETLPKEDPALDVLVRIESRIAFDKLKRLLEQCNRSKACIDLHKLKAFCHFLSDRWLAIKFTDSSYPHHPRTRANLAYLIFATAINQIEAIDIYTLVMPTVGALNCLTSRGMLMNFRLHEFVLGDDGRPIEIAKCLDEALNNKTDALHHTSGDKRPLSKSEKERVINHSSEANEYYDALQFYLKTGIENDLLIAKKQLHDMLESDDCEVTASYGVEGRRRLTKSILATVNDQKAFIDLMQSIPSSDWADFLKDMDTQDLEKYILQNDSFINALQKPSAYSKDETHNKAFLFCITELYKRARLCGNDYLNRWGYFADLSQKYLGDYAKYLQGYNRDEKLLAVDCLQAFFLSDSKLSEFHNYLKHSDNAKNVGPLYELGSHLAWITNQVEVVGDPAFFQPKPKGFIANWFG